MAKQTFTAGQVLTAAQMTALQANDYNQTVSTKTASYTLVASDAGTKIVMNSASDTTITVNTSLFTAGDTLTILNIGAGVCTITPGTATVSSATYLALVQYGGGTLYFTSTGVSVFQADSSVSPDVSNTNRNMIINGAMQVDQRNSGSSYTMLNATYGLDRWAGYSSAATKYSVQRLTTTPPTGFGYYQRVTSLAATADTGGAYYVLYQIIEGFNATKLAWGTASAKSVSLSFWVRSSLTGTFGGGLRNAGGAGGFYSYAFTYTINAANTWEYKTISITGSTAGTWGSTNDIGINLFLDLGTNASDTQAAGSWANANKLAANGCVRLIGTNAATLDITGVQFEAGSVATPFEFEQYSTTLAKCQRYYYVVPRTADVFSDILNGGTVDNSGYARYAVYRPPMRTESYTLVSTAANTFGNLNGGGNRVGTTINFTNGMINLYSASLATNESTIFRANNNTTAFVALSTEL